MRLFKKKQNQNKEFIPFNDPVWWNKCKELFKKETGGVIDHNDPEYNAQKIYQHWINSYFAK